ncbi:MAG: hypothetical protein GWO20_11330 [Candidatus Korarchaeota archaeon]|nr:hypothetical protein [Candidatus Korarchaeota archaeon]
MVKVPGPSLGVAVYDERGNSYLSQFKSNHASRWLFKTGLEFNRVSGPQGLAEISKGFD